MMDFFYKSILHIFDVANTFLGPIGFFISLFSFIKIKGVENSLKKQKERIVFNAEYKSFCKSIQNHVDIITTDGVTKKDIVAIQSLLDKIKRFSSGLEKADTKELLEHIKKIEKMFNCNSVVYSLDTAKELNIIKNIIEKAGDLNGI